MLELVILRGKGVEDSDPTLLPKYQQVLGLSILVCHLSLLGEGCYCQTRIDGGNMKIKERGDRLQQKHIAIVLYCRNGDCSQGAGDLGFWRAEKRWKFYLCVVLCSLRAKTCLQIFFHMLSCFSWLLTADVLISVGCLFKYVFLLVCRVQFLRPPETLYFRS